MPLAWWPEVRRDVQLYLPLTFVARGRGAAKASLTLTPSFTFAAAGKSTAAVALSMPPTFGIAQRTYPAAAGLTLTITPSMDGHQH